MRSWMWTAKKKKNVYNIWWSAPICLIEAPQTHINTTPLDQDVITWQQSTTFDVTVLKFYGGDILALAQIISNIF